MHSDDVIDDKRGDEMKEGANLHDYMGNETEEASREEDTTSDAIAQGEEKSATARNGVREGGDDHRRIEIDLRVNFFTILSQNTDAFMDRIGLHRI